MVGGDKFNGESAKVTVTGGNGRDVLGETKFDANAPIHLHFHFPENLILEKGQAPIFNINVNISKSDVDPTFHAEFLEIPETVGGDPGMGDVNPPANPKDPQP